MRKCLSWTRLMLVYKLKKIFTFAFTLLLVGCSILFNFESHDSPITTIISGEGYNLKNLDSSCDITSGGYARCSGNWKVLNQQSLSNFSLLRNYWGWPTRYIVVKHVSCFKSEFKWFITTHGHYFSLKIMFIIVTSRVIKQALFRINGMLFCSQLFALATNLSS